MDKAAIDKRGIVFRVLTLISVCLIAFSFVSPGWWVSLTAPNYPEATFPQGIRILFHMDSVRNGCTIRTSEEVEETEALSKSLHSRMKRVSEVRPLLIGRVKTAPTSPLVPSSS